MLVLKNNRGEEIMPCFTSFALILVVCRLGSSAFVYEPSTQKQVSLRGKSCLNSLLDSSAGGQLHDALFITEGVDQETSAVVHSLLSDRFDTFTTIKDELSKASMSPARVSDLTIFAQNGETLQKALLSKYEGFNLSSPIDPSKNTPMSNLQFEWHISNKWKFYTDIFIILLEKDSQEVDKDNRLAKRAEEDVLLMKLDKAFVANRFFLLLVGSRMQCTLKKVCLFCCEGATSCVTSLPMFSTHDQGVGFKHKTPVKQTPHLISARHKRPSFAKHYFRGARMRTTCITMFKNCFPYKDQNGVTRYEGSDERLKNLYEEALNFTSIRVPPPSIPGNFRIATGTATGLFALIHEKRIDFILSSTSLSLERDLISDLVPPYDFDGFMWVQAMPTRLGHALDVVTTLSFANWIGLIISTFVVFLLDRFISSKSRELEVYTGVNNPKIDTFHGLLVVLGTLLRQPDRVLDAPQPHSYRGLQAAWNVFCTFLGIIYCEMFYDKLITATFSERFETTLDVVSSEKHWICYNDTYYENIALYRPLGVKAIFQPYGERAYNLHYLMKKPQEMIGLIPAGPIANPAFEFPEVGQWYREGKFYVGKEWGADYTKGIVLPSNSPMLDSFTMATLRFFETGILDQTVKWLEMKESVFDLTFKQLRNFQAAYLASMSGSMPLPLEDFWGVLATTVFGYSLAFLVFLREVMCRNNPQLEVEEEEISSAGIEMSKGTTFVQQEDEKLAENLDNLTK